MNYAYLYIHPRSESREGPCFTAPVEAPHLPFYPGSGCPQPPGPLVVTFLGPPGSAFAEHTGLDDDVFLPAASFGGSFFPLCGVFSRCREQAPVVVRGLIAVAASLVAEHGLQSTDASVAVATGLCRSMACAIFPDQGLNLRLLHWQADSLSLCHQGRKPRDCISFQINHFRGIPWQSHG